jgi:hypothetical protein
VDAAKHTLHDADNTRQFYNSLVYCQTLILLALASDRPGPATVCSIAQLLGQLAGCISDEGINDARVLNRLKEQDREVYMTARRVFWAAFILDRFHASGHSKDMMLPLQAGSLSRDDYTALGGDVGYHLARKSLCADSKNTANNNQVQQKSSVRSLTPNEQGTYPTSTHRHLSRSLH